jgi:hypothetical protein
MRTRVSTAVKAALAPIVLLASSHAMATVNLMGGITGNGDVIVSLTDDTTDNSYSLDLGIGTTQLIAGTQGTTVWSASTATDASLNSFLASAGTDTISFSVVGGAYNNATQIQSSKFLSTTGGVAPTSGLPTNQGLESWSIMNSQFYTGLNQIAATSSGSLSSYTALKGATGNFGVNDNATVWFGQTANAFTTNLDIGSSPTSQALYEFASTATGTTLAQKNGAISTTLLGTFTASLVGGVFTLDYAAAGAATTPIPAALWLFGSGLLGLAGVGRRRKVDAA